MTLVDRARSALALPNHEAETQVASYLALANPADQAAILALVPAEKPGFFAMITAGMRNSEPEIQIAAISRVARCWPTTAEHLVLIRTLIGAPDPAVAQAAMTAIATIGDDRPLASLIDRLNDQGEIATTARRALITLTGHDAGLEPVMWEPLLAERDQHLIPTLAATTADFSAGDPERIRVSLNDLLRLTASRSAVAEALAPFLNHADPRVAALARGGLGNVGGGVAILVLKGELPPGAAPNPVRRVAPVQAPDHTGWFALIAVVSFLAIVAFLLFRTPLKDTKAVRNVTRAFTRSMVRSGHLRQMQKAKRNLEQTDLYRRGAKGVKQLEETRVYQALVKKPVAETVRDATASFRRKKP